MHGDLLPHGAFILGGEGAHQRDRILASTIAVVAEHGLAAASVARIATHARVSRRSFHAHFDDLDDALVAVIDEALSKVSALVCGALDESGSWHDRMRRALADVLAFFDDRPQLARVLLVETLTSGRDLLAHRRDAVDAFCALIAARVSVSPVYLSPLAAEGGLASVMGIVYTRLTEPDHLPLIELVGPLMGILTAAASDAPEVAAQVRLGGELARTIQPADKSPVDLLSVEGEALPATLRDPRAFRMRQCLLYVVRRPDSSNREIGDGIGLAHRGQLWALLENLSRMGLLGKRPRRPGHANSWRATTAGRDIAHRLHCGASVTDARTISE